MVIEHLFQVLQVKKQLQFKVIQLPLVEVEQQLQVELVESLEILQFLLHSHRQEEAVEELSQGKPVQLVDQVVVVDQVIHPHQLVEPVEQEIHLQFPLVFKDMLAEVQQITMQVAAAVAAALRQ